MESIINKEDITCGICGLIFDRSSEYKLCSNCFACCGCEVYFCPHCDNEIIVKPVQRKTGNRA